MTEQPKPSDSAPVEADDSVRWLRDVADMKAGVYRMEFEAKRFRAIADELERSRAEVARPMNDPEKLFCSSCREQFDGLGAIILSPPDEHQLTTRYNVCPDCWFSYKFVGPIRPAVKEQRGGREVSDNDSMQRALIVDLTTALENRNRELVQLRAENESLRAQLAEQKAITEDWRETASEIAKQRDEARRLLLGSQPPAWASSKCLICGGNHGALQCPQTVVT